MGRNKLYRAYRSSVGGPIASITLLMYFVDENKTSFPGSVSFHRGCIIVERIDKVCENKFLSIKVKRCYVK